MEFEVVIGIEVHCELLTKSKMFSSAAVTFGEKPNTKIHEIDLGFPGTMPSINKKAVEYAIRMCHALHMDIDYQLWFDRKNYYYADLPKGFQITQDKRPIGRNGYLEIDVDGEIKKIAIERLHLEEDTAKQVHYHDFTLVDYNRAGIPLIEIVTKPTIKSGKEAAAYLEKLRSYFLFTEISDAKMEEGSMRCDINISIMEKGSSVFGTKTEIKNLNSISNVQKAIDFEVERQKQIIINGGMVEQETRRFNEATKETVLMRSKGEAADYKYYTEPNILPIQLDASWVLSIKEQLPQLPEQRVKRYVEEYQISKVEAAILVSSKAISDFYEEAICYTKEYKLVANWILTELLAYINKHQIEFKELKITAKDLAELVNHIVKATISSKQAKQVFEEMMNTAKTVEQVIEEKGLQQVSDTSVIKEIILEVFKQQPQSIEDYKNGKTKAIGFLVGQVMKLSKGQANPAMTNKLVKDMLEEMI